MARPLASTLDRYLFRQLFVALLAVTIGLVALIWLTQSLRLIELVVNHGLSVRVFLELTGLLIPNFIAVILPITTFVVVQFVYQRLAGDRELTVMRAAGLSSLRLSRPALLLTLGVVVDLLHSEYLAGAGQLHLIPGISVRDPQPLGGISAAGRRVHAHFGGPDRLCPQPRS